MVLHPRGRHALGAGNEVEGRADAHLNGSERRIVFVGENLLPGAAKPDEHYAGVTTVDSLYQEVILMGAQRPEHRRLRADDLQRWKALDQAIPKLAHGLLGRAVEVYGHGALGGALAQPDGELGTVDAIAQPRTI